MRGRLRLLVAATTSAVIVAFVVPLVLLVHRLAWDRAVSDGQQEAQRISAALLTASDGRAVEDLVASYADAVDRVGVVLPDGRVVGDGSAGEEGVRLARGGAGVTQVVGEDPVVYLPTLVDEGTLVVRVQVPEAQTNLGVARATVTVCALGLLLLGGSLVVADRLARTVSRPFDELADAADAMREGDLDLRVPEDGLPEAAALGRALNGLAARVEELLVAEREVVADLSHRLRTPVTALRLDAEAVGDRETADRLREHVDHLERAVDAIVADARRPVRAAVTASCDVPAVVAGRVGFWAPLAEDQGRALTLDLPGRGLVANIDARELADVVDVLVDNVFAHTPEGCAVHVAVEDVPGRGVAVVVEDAGPGLPSTGLVERGASGGGSSGLGLDIARRAAEASGGTLALGRSALGGARVRVLLGRAR